MPNWCSNRLSITGDPEVLSGIARAAAQDQLFNYIEPEPKYEEDGNDILPNWYVWRLENWDCKWEPDISTSGKIQHDGRTLDISFDTAWSPPIKIYEVLLELDGIDKVFATYYEPGMAFAGVWDNGDDRYYSVNASFLKDTAPGISYDDRCELDEEYGITKWFEEYSD